MRFIPAYVAERFPLGVFAPAIAGLTGAAAWTAGEPSPATTIRTLVLAILLVAQFRLWDDLEDVDRDRIAHPERVLVRAPAAPFRALLALILVAAALLCAGSPSALVALLVLDTGFCVAYRLVRPAVQDETWRYCVLLLKYPSFVIVLSLAAGSVIARRLAIASAAAYICASAYELWHTRRAHLGASS